ncbi:type II toxin-antitoxin system RelE/ParE family toxin [Longimicrobium sp.]|uniref:type II toxin-antitoxin system RelE/ParE family toxin n=1 Tax=Longimicrobium sp. TaxID=2029185 RepID=UPI003B3ACD81
MRVRYSALARADIRDAKAFYRKENETIPARLAAELRHALRRIRENPQSGAPYELGTRRFILSRFPYAVVYYPTLEGIYVVAVQHHSRDPDYWHRSVSEFY